MQKDIDRKKNRVAVYTANFGTKDTVPEVKPEEGVDYYCFTDNENFVGAGWEIIKFLPMLSDRKTARFFKANSHILFREYDYTVWKDGRITLKKNISAFIELLGDNHIATSKHRKRDCLYEEAEVCKEWGLDDDKVIDHQISCIKKNGYPKNQGLSETGILIRDNSEEVMKFNTHWHTFLMGHSIRDQLSFNYILWKMKQEWSIIPPNYYNLGKHNNEN